MIYLVTRPYGNDFAARSDSLLDAAGQPTPLAAEAGLINARLAEIGPVLMRAESNGFYTVGQMPAQIPAPADSPLAGVASDAENDGLMVGLFSQGQDRYAMVVRKPSDCVDVARVQIEPKPGSGVFSLEGTPIAGNSLDLLPGEGRLVLLRPLQ